MEILIEEECQKLKVTKHVYIGKISIQQNFYFLMMKLLEKLRTTVEIQEEEKINLGVLSKKIQMHGNIAQYHIVNVRINL